MDDRTVIAVTSIICCMIVFVAALCAFVEVETAKMTAQIVLAR